MHVEFQPQGSDQPWSSTAELPIVPGESTNVFVAGMLPDTTYLMRHVLNDGTTSAPLTFTTGPLPTNVTFPTFSVQQAPTPGTGLTQDIVFHVGVSGPNGTVDRGDGPDGQHRLVLRPGGQRVPQHRPEPRAGRDGPPARPQQDRETGASELREVDLAGDTLRETNIDAVNAQLAALGRPSITDFNHDVQRLPQRGHGGAGQEPEDHQDQRQTHSVRGRHGPRPGPRLPGGVGLGPLRLAERPPPPHAGLRPRQWTHANSIAWSPADGNLIVSMRSMDWVIKINYANGTGDGTSSGGWGGAAISGSGPRTHPRGSRTSTTRYINDTTLVLFDNGNGRRRETRGRRAAGRELVLDEKRRVARLVVNADLGTYAPFTGSAQKLPNGNFVSRFPARRGDDRDAS